MTELAAKILQHRARTNTKQCEFAKKCKISVVTLSNIETSKITGSNITIAKINNIIDIENKKRRIEDEHNQN